MKIAVLDDYLDVARTGVDWSALQTDNELCVFKGSLPSSLEDRAAALAGFDVIVAMRERTPFPSELIARLPDLRLLVTTSMRNLSIDMSACANHGVLVCGAPGSKDSSLATVELAWAMILGLSKNVVAEKAAMAQGLWQTQMPVLLAGKTLALVGLGNLGHGMASVGRAFGMDVIAYSPNLTQERAQQGGARCVTKEELFRLGDFISVHMVLADSTRGLVSQELIGAMKPTACLVNTSRAGLVDMDALYQSLKNKDIAGAGLDVFPVEPLPANDPFRQLDNVLLTPHLGYVNPENMQAFYENVIKAIQAWDEGEPINVLN